MIVGSVPLFGISDARDSVAFDWSQRAAEMLLSYGIAYTVKNPLQALGIVAVLSNPLLRATALELFGMLAKGAVRDTWAGAKIVTHNLVAPRLARSRATMTAILRSPATAAIVFVVGGAAIATHTQQVINDNAIAINQDLTRGGGQTRETARFDLFRSDLPLIWSPGGGYGSFSVV